jgi:uncharacterized protein (DUF1501 family)
VAALGQLGLSSALAADTGSYRAMVGVFLFGGNDAWNMVVPADSRYADYAKQRGAGLALAQSSLVPLTGTAFGLHAAMAPLKAVWDDGGLGAVLNTGTLFAPLTKALYTSRPDLRPLNLMSHEDQQNQWQGMRMRSTNNDGFMGRLNDRAAAASLPPLISIAGSNLALIGDRSAPLILPSTGSIVRNGYNAASTDAAVKARQAALDVFADASSYGAVTDLTGKGMSSAYAQAVQANSIISSTTSAVDKYFVNPTTNAALTSDISRQLLRAARMIEARGTLGHAKQTFFVSQGGYDTHTNELASAQRALWRPRHGLGRFLQRHEGPGPAGQRHRLHDVGLRPGLQRQRQRRQRSRLGLQPSGGRRRPGQRQGPRPLSGRDVRRQ